MIGVSQHPASTLLDRVLVELNAGPAPAIALCGSVLGMPTAPRAVAERLLIALLGADQRVRQLVDGRWGLVPEVQGSPSLDDCAFAVVDVETTGMRANGGDRITEIAVVIVCGERREVVFESLVNPGRPIPYAISRITNITDDMVRGAPRFEAIADEVLAALSGRVFVAHNARFDWSFVSAEVRRARDMELDGARLCTVRLARRLVRNVRSCGLDNLSQHFAFENPARHRAAGDAIVTAQLLRLLLDLARGDGARTLQDLEAIGTRKAPRRRTAMPSAPRHDSMPEGPA